MKSQKISKGAFAKQQKVSASMVSKWIRLGMPAENGRIDPVEARAWLDANTSQPSGSESLTAARTRKESALASLRELELAKARGELLTVEQYENSMAAMIGAARAKLLSLPRAVAATVATLSTAAECERIITDALYEALAELAKEVPNG